VSPASAVFLFSPSGANIGSPHTPESNAAPRPTVTAPDRLFLDPTPGQGPAEDPAVTPGLNDVIDPSPTLGSSPPPADDEWS